jgi:carbonic anhydrase
VIHHTGCGMLLFKDEDIRAKITADLGAEAGADVATLPFLPFSDLEQSVRDDIAAIKAAKYIAKVPVFGYIYHVE